jgi:3-phenylpropionate/trans-cinnamate dioxygenase ferredoxin subunit
LRKYRDVSHNFVNVVALDQLRESYVTRFEIGSRSIILTRTAEGVHAFDATCTHSDFQFVTSRLAGGCDIECPMHGACFDAVTGEPTYGPADRPLPSYAVRIEGDMVQVDARWTADTTVR